MCRGRRAKKKTLKCCNIRMHNTTTTIQERYGVVFMEAKCRLHSLAFLIRWKVDMEMEGGGVLAPHKMLHN